MLIQFVLLFLTRREETEGVEKLGSCQNFCQAGDKVEIVNGKL